MEIQNRGRQWSVGYKIFWAVYWACVFIFLMTQRSTLIGSVKVEMRAGEILFAVLTAAVAASALLCTFVLHPLDKVDQRGKQARLQIWPWHFLIMLAVDVWCFFIIEYINNTELVAMEWKYRLLNIAGILIMNLIAFFWLNSLKRSLMLILSIWSFISIAFYFVYLFRGEPLQLIDFFSISTAATVSGSYTYTLTRGIVLDLVVYFCVLGLLIHMRNYVLVRKGVIRKILMRAGIAVFMVGMYFFYLNVNWNGGLGILTDLFAPIKTYTEYGTTVGFFCVAKYMRLSPPDGYTVSGTKKIAEDSVKSQESGSDGSNTSDTSSVKPVNIIAIMNESWADYSYIGDLKTNEPVMPFYDSLEENTIKGHTQVCITGGGTAKTEYEFLTGNSVKRFPAMVPYVSYFTHDQYSIVSTLEAQGYKTAAMHPYKGSNWNRETAYRLLGFDRFYTQDDFTEDDDVEYVHSHISDMSNYKKIIQVVNEENQAGNPFFLFDITMQNHGGYTADDVDETITVDGYENDVVSRFLSLEKLSDDALEYLIDYFKNYDEPTLIIMFGDHYPTMPDSFTEYVSGANYNSLDLEQQEHYYATPFLIWANYDIPEEQNVVTSTNYLSTMLLEQTGLQMTDYNYYLKNLMTKIPALNHMGYEDADGNWHTWSSGSEEDLLNEWQYECLQYNELAEKRNRLDWFFSLTSDS
ncbi:MAG: LTA synthase family protein [Bilifractor sp.]|jgi:phosphoglycerol transferase MdoB-like AlkP superfamily enzyme